MRIKRWLAFIIVALLSLFIWLPIWIMLTGSLMGKSEIEECIGPVMVGTEWESTEEESTDEENTDKEKTGQEKAGQEKAEAGINTGDNYISWHLIPQYPTLMPYVELLLDSPGFFAMFWNSCLQVIPGVFGQLLIAVPAAWAIARYQFPGKRAVFILYIILMIMPFQVTMVSGYLVLDRLHMIDTHLAVIVPAVFSTFPVFILTKFFKDIPETMMEAARIDGASERQIFCHIGIPLGASGIVSIVVLNFLEGWNAIEQPLTFLRSKSLWPLSLYLPSITTERVGVAFVASVIVMIPSVLIFLYGQQYLEQGIVASGIKE